jgi:hypothetical protein
MITMACVVLLNKHEFVLRKDDWHKDFANIEGETVLLFIRKDGLETYTFNWKNVALVREYEVLER